MENQTVIVKKGFVQQVFSNVPAVVSTVTAIVTIVGFFVGMKFTLSAQAEVIKQQGDDLRSYQTKVVELEKVSAVQTERYAEINKKLDRIIVKIDGY